MTNAQTNLEARILGVQWVRLDRHAFWVAGYTNAATPYPLSEIRHAEAYVERNALRSRKAPGEYDSRLSDGMVYTAIGIIGGSVLLGPLGFIAAMAAGIFLIRRDSQGILAIDLHFTGGRTETIRIWDVSPQLLGVAVELLRATGSQDRIGNR